MFLFISLNKSDNCADRKTFIRFSYMTERKPLTSPSLSSYLSRESVVGGLTPSPCGGTTPSPLVHRLDADKKVFMLNASKPKKNSKKNRGRKPNSSREVSLEGARLVMCPAFPPDHNLAPTKRCWRRFNQSGAVVNQAFTLAMGHDQFLVVTNVTGAAVPYADCWRIRTIRVWAISEANFTTHVTISPVGADIDSNMYNDKEQIFHCSSRSQAEPGAMSIRTAPDKPWGSWHFTSTVNFAGTLFQVNIGINAGSSNNRCTMDIEFEYVENLVGLPLGYGVTTATTTLGTVGGRNILSGFTLTGTNNLG